MAEKTLPIDEVFDTDTGTIKGLTDGDYVYPVLTPAQVAATQSLVSEDGIVAMDVSGEGAASANTAAIQAALALRGSVRLVGRGTAYVNSTCILDDNTDVTIPSGLSVAPKITIRGGNVDGLALVRAGMSGMSVHVSGTAATTMTNGFIRAENNAAVSVVDGGGNTVPAGKYLTRVGGSEAVSVNGAGAQVDVTAIARTAGSVVYNTNAAAGTLAAAGVVICDASAASGSWKLATDTSKSY